MLALWPDEAQTWLLHAALDDGEDALRAYAAWRRLAGPIAALDPGSKRLLPLLHANLKRLGSPEDGLADFYRRSWGGTQRLLHEAAGVLRLLASAGIPVMMTKGIVLGLCNYPAPAHRPMSDIDIIVPPDCLARAVGALRDGGWRAGLPEDALQYWEDVVLYKQSIPYLNGDGRELDLHWALGTELMSRRAIDRLWKNAAPVAVLGEPALRPSATDMIAHLAVHGLRRNEVPPLRWIADVAMVFRTEGDKVDWDEMAEFAARERIFSRLGLALDYAAGEFALPVPQAILARWRRYRPSLGERIEDWVALTDPEQSWLRKRSWSSLIAATSRVIVDGHLGKFPRLARRWIARRARILIGRHKVGEQAG